MGDDPGEGSGVRGVDLAEGPGVREDDVLSQMTTVADWTLSTLAICQHVVVLFTQPP